MSTPLRSWIRNPLYWAIFLAGLVHCSGAIGMSFFDRAFFIPFTPINLLLMLLLLILNEPRLKGPFVWGFLVAFAVGMVSEMVGVNTGFLFGNYTYGEVFGTKMFGVPPLIGINWFCVVYSSYVVVGCLGKHVELGFFFSALLTAFITTAFDWIMEPVAMELDFWNWANGLIPLFNYVSWFIISFFVVLLFGLLKLDRNNPFAPYFLFIQAIFFLFLRIVLAAQA